MQYKRPIIIVEDDSDDCEILTDLIKNLGYGEEFRCFKNGQELLDYLKTTDEKPYIVISDVRMPVMDGKEAKRRINEDVHLRLKAFPFIFLSTTYSQAEVREAYAMDVNGYFRKAADFDVLENTVRSIFEYWDLSTRPS